LRETEPAETETEANNSQGQTSRIRIFLPQSMSWARPKGRQAAKVGERR